MSATGSSDAPRFTGRFNPFQDPYLADPYPFFAEAREATPVFYSPDLDCWVVTRYHDIRKIFQTPTAFSSANTLTPLQPICPAAGHLLAEGGFRPIPPVADRQRPAGAHASAAARKRRVHPSACRGHGTVRPGTHLAIRRGAADERPGRSGPKSGLGSARGS